MVKALTTDIRYLKGIGPKRAKLFNNLGIHSIEDFLYYLPRRYEDRTKLTDIAKLKIGEYQTIEAKILGLGESLSFRRRFFNIFEVVVEDSSGRLPCVWFNQPYLKQYFKPGKEVVLYGKIDLHRGRLQMQNPQYEILDSESKDNLNYGRIVPIYSLVEKLGQRMLRRIIKCCLDEYLPKFRDILPYDIRQGHHLLNIAGSILNMHFPKDIPTQESAYKRILFEECFLLQLLFGLKRLKADKIRGISHKINEDFMAEFEKGLPFELTSSQMKVIRELRQDMASLKPMHRLLQGDVGSGKTIVALYGCMLAVSSGYQSAFMVPTELLAWQHYQTIKSQVSGVKYGGRAINVALLTSSLNKKEREKIYKDVKGAKVDILVGTHALIQEHLEFKNLSLVVIDEQHKFGVHQRLSLLTKTVNPDCLIMTATPIPRTLAMTIYADLDISTIDELPKERLPVVTCLVDESRRQWVYDFIKENLQAGRQAYIVYPIIEESKTLDLKAASIMYEDLKKNVFSEYRVGLVHGRLKQKERCNIMQSFKDGKLDILVSTVVIEVGIDVSNASVMVIEHAQRFGLSQLHQLRGRVGRGKYQSHCILISDAATGDAGERLQAMASVSDGFKIAEIDLEIRGPGEFFGVRQHGMPELRVNPLGNWEVINIAKQEAKRLLEKDPSLDSRQNQGLKYTLSARFPDYEKLMAA
jgi:ATP-dependent DNA helicase RecG